MFANHAPWHSSCDATCDSEWPSRPRGGIKFVGAHLAGSAIDGGFRPARFWARPSAIGACHLEMITVHMDWMVGHREISEADAHAIALAHDERIDAREDAAIPAPQIKFNICAIRGTYEPGSMS